MVGRNRQTHRLQKVIERAKLQERVLQLLYSTNSSQREIAEQLGVGPHVVQAVLADYKRDVLARVDSTQREKLAELLAELEEMVRESRLQYTLATPEEKARWMTERRKNLETIADLYGVGPAATPTVNITTNTQNNVVVNVQAMAPDERQRYISELTAQRERCLAREKRGRALLPRLTGDTGAPS